MYESFAQPQLIPEQRISSGRIDSGWVASPGPDMIGMQIIPGLRHQGMKLFEHFLCSGVGAA